RRRHHYRRHVPQPQIGSGWKIDAHLHQHAHDGLHGERRLTGLVARAIEPHHQAVPDELVGPHALDRRKILYALSLGRGSNGAAAKPEHGKDQANLSRKVRANCSEWHLLASSERRHGQEKTREPAHRLRLVDIASGLVFDLRIRYLDRRYRVVDDGLRPHHAGETNVFGPLRHGQLLLPAHQQIAVGQHLQHGNGNGAGKIIGGSCRAFTQVIVFGGRADIHVFSNWYPEHHGWNGKIYAAALVDAAVRLLACVGLFIDDDHDGVPHLARTAILKQGPVMRARLEDSAIAGWRLKRRRSSRHGLLHNRRRSRQAHAAGEPEQHDTKRKRYHCLHERPGSLRGDL